MEMVMGMVIVAIVFVGTLTVIAAASWWLVFRDARGGEPLCPHCRCSMSLMQTPLEPRLTLRCKRCDDTGSQQSGSANAWARSGLHPPR